MSKEQDSDSRPEPPPRIVPALGLIKMGWQDMKEAWAEMRGKRPPQRKDESR